MTKLQEELRERSRRIREPLARVVQRCELSLTRDLSEELEEHFQEILSDALAVLREYDEILELSEVTVASFDSTDPSQAEVRLDGWTILVAEDEPVNQRLLERILEMRGAKVLAVGNGEEAVRKVETGAFDLVLMDVNMPVLDGLSAARAIRAHAEVKVAGTPIIAITAQAFEEDLKACLDAGMNSYVSKPFQFSELFEKISRALSINASHG